MQQAVLHRRTPDTSKLRPSSRRRQAKRVDGGTAVPEPGDVRKRRNAERAALVAVRLHDRLEEVALVLVPEPAFIEIVELAQEAVGGELRDPDGVEYREIRCLPLGDCMRQRLVKRPQRHRDQVDLKLVRSGVAEEISPRPLRYND